MSVSIVPTLPATDRDTIRINKEWRMQQMKLNSLKRVSFFYLFIYLQKLL